MSTILNKCFPRKNPVNWRGKSEDITLVSSTVDDCLQRQIAQRILNSEIEACPVNVGHYMAFKHSISFATHLVSIHSESCQTLFQAFAILHLKLMYCSIQIWQTPFSETGRQFRSAALHKIGLRTCWFVPMSIFYSKTNEWLKYWAKQWALLWSAATSCWFHRKFHFK